MGLWQFLGGEINYDWVNKKNNKPIKYQDELFEIRYKQWKKSNLPVDEKLKRFIYNFGEEFVKSFLKNYHNLVPNELNPFIKIEVSENEKLKKLKNFMRKNK